jgi:hypothetical protein
MRTKDAAKMLGGSIAIYFIMAACGQGVGPSGGLSMTGMGASGSLAASGAMAGGKDASQGVASEGSAESGGSSSMFDAARIVDALSDPVSIAKADDDQSGTRLKVKRYVGTDGSSSLSLPRSRGQCSYAALDSLQFINSNSVGLRYPMVECRRCRL